MFLKLLLISASLLAIAMLGFAVRILVMKSPAMSSSSVGGSKAMRSRKIYCPQVMQKMEDKKVREEILQKNSSCGGCPVKEQC